MLHIHNGDSSASTAIKAGIPATISPGARRWSVVPLPAIWRNQNSLKSEPPTSPQAYAVPIEKVEAELREQYAAIENFSEHEEVVLWLSTIYSARSIWSICWHGLPERSRQHKVEPDFH
jgi:hypothetical protein